MFFDRKVFLFCGPTVFGAAEKKGVSILEYPEMYTEIGPHYLERTAAPRQREWDASLNRIVEVDREKKTGNHELCRYCFANNNFELAEHEHVAFSSFTNSQNSQGSWDLDRGRFFCAHMPSAIEVVVDSGGLASTGASGHLVYGPYVKIERESQYCAELCYLTKSCPGWRAGEFEVTVSWPGSGGVQREFRTLGRTDLRATDGDICESRIKFSTNGFLGALLETRVYVETSVEMNAFEIRTWRTDLDSRMHTVLEAKHPPSNS
jgi:hypothetical protein